MRCSRWSEGGPLAAVLWHLLRRVFGLFCIHLTAREARMPWDTKNQLRRVALWRLHPFTSESMPGAQPAPGRPGPPAFGRHRAA